MCDHGWRTTFVARDDELAWLKQAWADAQSGRPRFLVLLGESGLGKTRLIQQFYRWLSSTQDPPADGGPEGYWPDAFTSEVGSLDVNPRFSPEQGDGWPSSARRPRRRATS